MHVGLDSGSHDRHPHHTLELFIEGGPEDDHGIGIDFLADPVRGLINLEQGHVHATGDVDQHGAGPLHRDIVEQRVVDRGLGGLCRPAVARRLASAHHGLSHLAHHRANVGEVEIYLARLYHQVGHTGNTLMKHRVGHVERIREGGAFIGQPEQVLVRDHDQRVDETLHLGDAGLGLRHAALPLEVKRLGDDADGQDTALTRRPCDDRRRAGAGAATHAGRDEDHVAIRELAHHRLDAFLGGGASDIRLRAGAKTLCDGTAKLDLPAGE